MVGATRKAKYHRGWAEKIVATLSPAAQRFVTVPVIVDALDKAAPAVFLANVANTSRYAMEEAAYRAAADAVARLGF